MGIPKFFRWLSERYPLSTELVTENRIPEFDNLYLDMNGIIHVCSHPNDDVSFRITEKEIFISIFRYIEYIFTKIKPRKLFFLAVDGVAPRAKMNQQRARRFRTAQEAKQKLEEAKKKGLEIPEDPAFDSNCITPGTVFMNNLHEALKYFIAKKISEDSEWKDVQVVLSGHDVPGEGEHKIMEYIRLAKSRPDYNPNIRHCLYGLDADLIMLGLLSHEPHFALLREEVKFGLSRKSSTKKTPNFYLLHLSLLREYLDIDFQVLKSSIPFEYSLERIIDDYILMGFFVGNDFLPRLPGLHINEGAFELIFETYKQLLPTLGGYLNDGGQINFVRLEKLLSIIGEREVEAFKELIPEPPQPSKKVKNPIWFSQLQAFITGPLNQLKINIPVQDTLQVTGLVKQLGLECDIVHDEDEFSTKRTIIVSREPDSDDEGFIAQERVLKRFAYQEPAPEFDEKEFITREMDSWKRDYYKSKLEINYDNQDEMDHVIFSYAQGLQWVLYYYYLGVQSWEWFFPYHYSPKITDIKGLDRFSFKFDLGKPFFPFEQLMGVLPPASQQFIPEAFRSLMTDPGSPILDFYPLKFELDASDVKTPWEAVVKIPFIDEDRLLNALQSRAHLLSASEKRRNSFGPSLSFVHTREDGEPYESCIPGLPDIAHLHCLMTIFNLPVLGENGFLNSLCKNAKQGAELLAGFPSFCTREFTSSIGVHGINLHGYPSREPSVIVTISNPFEGANIDTLASSLVGKQVFVGWPFLLEAQVKSLVDELFEYTIENNQVVKSPHSDKSFNEFEKTRFSLESFHSKKMGILIGQVDVIVKVNVLSGMIVQHDGALVKDFSGPTSSFALQTLMMGDYEDPRYKYQPPPKLEDEFPQGLVIFSVIPGAFGIPCKVLGYVGEKLKLRLKRNKVAELDVQPSITRDIAQQEQKDKWFTVKQVARFLQCPISVISRVTTGLYIYIKGTETKFNIGLGLKFESKGLKVLGYTRKSNDGWEFTQKAVNLISEYKQAFPPLFTVLSSRPTSGTYDHTDFFDDTPQGLEQAKKILKAMKEWIQEKGVDKLATCSIDQSSLSVEAIQLIEKAVDDYNTNCNNVGYRFVDVAGTRGSVLKPDQAKYRLSHQVFDLGDRVVCVADFGSVPLGTFGTVVAKDGDYLDVVYDIPILGGHDLNGRCTPGKGFVVHKLTVLNLSHVQPPPSMKSKAQVKTIQVGTLAAPDPLQKQPVKPMKIAPRPAFEAPRNPPVLHQEPNPQELTQEILKKIVPKSTPTADSSNTSMTSNGDVNVIAPRTASTPPKKSPPSRPKSKQVKSQKKQDVQPTRIASRQDQDVQPTKIASRQDQDIKPDSPPSNQEKSTPKPKKKKAPKDGQAAIEEQLKALLLGPKKMDNQEASSQLLAILKNKSNE